ncbi:MAG: hypothetical protein LC746_03435 [Acidobacteria bacterium]|nr:hypothetical protein [Acidobacteriota bacterium]
MCRMLRRVTLPLVFTTPDSSMNVTDFIAKWRKSERTERSAAQEHFT